MSWEIFRCDINCQDDTPETSMCISENMYKGQTDALAAGGYIGAGYTGIHMDDWSVAACVVLIILIANSRWHA